MKLIELLLCGDIAANVFAPEPSADSSRAFRGLIQSLQRTQMSPRTRG